MPGVIPTRPARIIIEEATTWFFDLGMGVRSSIFKIMLILAAVMLGGCPLAASRFFVSSAIIESGDFKISKTGRMEIGDLVMVIRPTNALLTYSGDDYFSVPVRGHSLDPSEYSYPFSYYEDFDYGRKQLPDYFILELLFVVTSDDVTLDLGRIILSTDGRNISSTSYYALERRYQGILSSGGSAYVSPLCKEPGGKAWSGANALTLVKEHAVNKPVHLRKKGDNCFAVKFMYPPPDPRTRFKIKIDGLTVDGKLISLPAIEFVPDAIYLRSS